MPAVRSARTIASSAASLARIVVGPRADALEQTLDHLFGTFPRPPLYTFQGRARELQALERAFRTDRAILLHAMGGMGKTTMAREAGNWLARTGLFPDGACFLSFEQPVSAERIAQVLGSYLEGHGFAALSQAEQLERTRQLFQEQEVFRTNSMSRSG
jgi:hypothetical protein